MADVVLGRESDGTAVQVGTDELMTHAVIVGMTGSGKTGLGVGVLEEVLAAGVPALVIDPKGDLTNLALVFPELAPTDFGQWIDPAQAKAAGVTPEAFAAAQAELWREGLAGWGIGTTELREFCNSHDVTIYTPGSTAGVPLNVLGSLAAPTTDDAEQLADEVDGYVTGLLSLVGIDADPLSSREHILLSNLLLAAWQAGEDIDLPTLLGRVQQPPMRKLGVFELDQFFPAKDRMAFAVKLNGLLAAPGFAPWLEGEPIDIQRMLYATDGKPRCAVVTTAHLSDDQRLSVTSMLLTKLIAWMRRQSGTTDLRAMLYLDEVAGYLPPTANPPTKKPLLLLMKQARAFGVGVVLASQNPVDLDYKALSNAGTWLVGRLSTDQDRARLKAGLAAGGVDSREVSATVAGLGKRQFVLRKADGRVCVFGTRWVRSYLRGPMTRDQIARLTADVRPVAAEPASPPPVEAAVVEVGDDETQVMPAVAEGVASWFVDPAAPWLSAVGVATESGGQRLAAAAVARVLLSYNDARAGISHEDEYEAVIFPLPPSTDVLAPISVDYDDRDLIPEAPTAARFAVPEAKIGTKTYWTALRRDLTDHLVRSAGLDIFGNSALKIYSRVGETEEEFRARCAQVGKDRADAEIAALQSKYATKLRSWQSKLAAASDRAEQASAARTSGMVTDVGSLLGGFLGGRRSSAAIGAAARRAQAASNRATAAAAKVDDVQRQIADIEAEFVAESAAITASWDEKSAHIEPVTIAAKKTGIRVADLGLVWLPVTT
ncbi:MAG: ATP-binding protein [Actinobacteria bacterium]|nr:ATP-binding protein [Actinomycetota bacterium]